MIEVLMQREVCVSRDFYHAGYFCQEGKGAHADTPASDVRMAC